MSVDLPFKESTLLIETKGATSDDRELLIELNGPELPVEVGNVLFHEPE